MRCYTTTQVTSRVATYLIIPRVDCASKVGRHRVGGVATTAVNVLSNTVKGGA